MFSVSPHSNIPLEYHLATSFLGSLPFSVMFVSCGAIIHDYCILGLNLQLKQIGILAIVALYSLMPFILRVSFTKYYSTQQKFNYNV